MSRLAIIRTSRKCGYCGIDKPISEYSTAQTTCRECRRKDGYRYRYGITYDEYAELIKKQQGCCALCDEPCDKLQVDHNHKTNEYRALLCRRCNNGLGMFKESIELFQKAINYLKGEK